MFIAIIAVIVILHKIDHRTFLESLTTGLRVMATTDEGVLFTGKVTYINRLEGRVFVENDTTGESINVKLQNVESYIPEEFEYSA